MADEKCGLFVRCFQGNSSSVGKLNKDFGKLRPNQEKKKCIPLLIPSRFSLQGREKPCIEFTLSRHEGIQIEN